MANGNEFKRKTKIQTYCGNSIKSQKYNSFRCSIRLSENLIMNKLIYIHFFEWDLFRDGIEINALCSPYIHDIYLVKIG